MLDFLKEERKKVILGYPLIKDFFEGKIATDEFLRQLQSFRTELADKNITELTLIALKKAQELENSKKLYIRFMNLQEFLEIFNLGLVKPKNAILTRKRLSYFKNRNNWSSTISSFVLWELGTKSTYFYKKIEGSYIKTLNEARQLSKIGKINNPKVWALIKFRFWLLDFIAKGFGLDFNINSENIEEEIKELKKKYIILFDSIFKPSYDKDFWSRHNLFIALLDDPYYLVTNKSKLKDIFLAFSGSKLSERLLSRILAVKKYQTKITEDVPNFIEEIRVYHLILFVNKEIFHFGPISTKLKFLISRTFPFYWGRIHGDIKNLIGCLIMMPSSKLYRDVVNVVINSCKKDINNAIPVYDTKGRLFWPR